MKRIIKVSTGRFGSENYIDNHVDYDIDCDVLEQKRIGFRKNYVLKLEGAPEDIKLYLNYLKCSGFKIH